MPRPKGKKTTTPTEAECILKDAVVIGFKAAAKKHHIGESTIYGLTYRYPEGWRRVRDQMRPLVEAETRDTWVLARNLLVKQMQAPDALTRFKPYDLAKILQTCGIQFERFIRMDGMQMTLAEQIAALREAVLKGNQQALDVIKELASQLSLEQIDDVAEHMRKSGIESGED